MRVDSVEIGQDARSQEHGSQQRRHYDKRCSSILRLRFLESGNTIRDSLNTCQCGATVRESSKNQEESQGLQPIPFSSLDHFRAWDCCSPAIRVVTEKPITNHEEKANKESVRGRCKKRTRF